MQKMFSSSTMGNNSGPKAPTGLRYLSPASNDINPNGIPIPFFFQAETAGEFQNMDFAEDDVLLTTLPFGGTIWVHKILHNLMHGFDELGKQLPEQEGPSRMGTIFVESLPTQLLEGATPEAEQAEQLRRELFGGPRGNWKFEHLLKQAKPRMFSTHLYGRMLPAKLTEPNGRGRLVVAVRNLKDVLVSNHFFRGEPKDGWLGNEHGPGSFNRFVDPDTPNAYGSMFTWVREMDKVVESMKSSGRVLVVQYEELMMDMPAQIRRIACFLGQDSVSEAKLDAVVRASGFLAYGESRNAGLTTEICLSSIFAPKGGVRDWCHHLTEDKWREFDEIFQHHLSGCPLAERLHTYQRWNFEEDREMTDADAMGGGT